MTEQSPNDKLFDALLDLAVTDAMEKEIDNLPSEEELNAIYKPSNEMNARINHIIKTGLRKHKRKRVIKTVNRIAASLVILFVVMSAALLSVKATRNAIFNAFLDWQNKSTDIRFTDPDKNNLDVIRPAYIPVGYSETSTEKFGSVYTIIYSNSQGNEILFDQWPAESSNTSIDNENTNMTEITVGGNKAYLFEAANEIQKSVLIWEAEGIVFQLTAQIDSDELIRIAETIKK